MKKKGKNGVILARSTKIFPTDSLATERVFCFDDRCSISFRSRYVAVQSKSDIVWSGIWYMGKIKVIALTYNCNHDSHENIHRRHELYLYECLRRKIKFYNVRVHNKLMLFAILSEPFIGDCCLFITDLMKHCVNSLLVSLSHNFPIFESWWKNSFMAKARLFGKMDYGLVSKQMCYIF